MTLKQFIVHALMGVLTGLFVAAALVGVLYMIHYAQTNPLGNQR